ncbi:hypothetical protein SUGI_0981510 [Cryptomeria japonica]|uniref:histone-lysine N-methyltransferase, H3 lysine-9 specific SUVH6 isoform X2 n=1 Tax=Cryptomeria japonica TaxID=3369 RepID=UPI002414B22D|nr:histone-lysine N-methyltransferase, H3 lysine-9 specific SUVH6 isoform X2 [Cryptomeria japonica]GLJ46575.1 hypothetical protein SUGI_0981510 [Cryptomeria japonica]
MGEVANPASVPAAVQCEPSSTATKSLKKKKKKPSAFRDFPPGCGRFAEPIIRNLNPSPSFSAAHKEGKQEISTPKQPEMPSLSPHSPLYSVSDHLQHQKNSLHIETSSPSRPPLPDHEEQHHSTIVKDPENLPSTGHLERQQIPIATEAEGGILDSLEAISPATAGMLMCSPDSPTAAPVNLSPLSVSAVRDFSVCSTCPEMLMCPLLTQPFSPSTAPIRFPKRFVSANRDFPFGCGRNAPPTTREECLRAIAAHKASKDPTMQLIPFPATLEQAEANSDLDSKTVVNQLDLIPKDNEAMPVPTFIDSEATPTAPYEELAHSSDEEKNLSNRQALMVSTNHNSEMSQKSKANGEIAYSGIVLRNRASSSSIQPRRKNNLPDGQALMISSSTESQLSDPNTSEDSKETPKYGVSGLKVEEGLPYGQGLLEASPIPLHSQTKPKRVQKSKGKVKAADGGSSTNTSKKKSQLNLKPKVQSVSFALTPFDSADGQAKSDGDGTVTRAKVRETMRLFQVLYRKFLQEEENRSKESRQGHRRPDIMAANVLKEKNKYLNTGEKIVGNVPGVEVGDEFHYRIELMIVGLHGQSQGGIDYLNLKKGKSILATSIVASGGYADNDEGEVLIYSGQGGNRDKKGKQMEDQKLERGNLALKNCIDAGSPVRVIRGFKDSRNSGGGRGSQDATLSKTGTTYTYDGLYLVERYWQETGTSGFSVFKFQLRRMPGQPELAWNIVKSVGRAKKGAPREGLCLQDISQGKETRPICVVNTVDDEAGPAPFEYTAKIIYPSGFNPPPPRGCACVDECSDSEKCLCAVKNGGELPYNYTGSIVEAKPLVYECGPSCKCPPTCHNRVSQHGVRNNLEIFKTDKRGWGVRSLSSITSGSFICEYTGELLSDMEAEQRTGNDEYLFDIGRSNDQSLWDGLSGLVNELPSHSISETVEDVGYTIDAAKYGSVGRFINHSCSPNLYAQNVLFDHDDKNIPHIMLFAAENIPPLQELCYHYNYNPDSVRDSDGNIKKKSCYCGSDECTGRLY